MKILPYISAFFLLSTWYASSAQYIIQTDGEHTIGALTKSLGSNSIEPLYTRLNIYKAGKDVKEEDLRKNPHILAYEIDQRLTNRTDPDDLFYPMQYNLPLINIAPVWESLPQAVDYGGREVVVAILDDGFQIDHPELIDNIYTNSGEIPLNGIDDDNNGIIDDYQGWNQNRGDGQHAVKTHGTAVAGIIGAKGNNSEGIAGVSWNVKMLPISGIDFRSDIIGALANIADLRRAWNESNGQRGVYIVVSSYSGGIPSAFPDGIGNGLWCNLYDEMGELGILSVGATVNNDTDIEISGDMPSLCTSPYLVVTTNIDQNAVKVRNAGFSSISVDLGAPGSDIITTNVGSDYSPFTGTSAATPHVAGVAAQLFCTPCPTFYETIINDPGRSVLDVRSAILNTTVPESSLTDVTTTGGRLDAGGALAAMQTTICGGSRGDLDIQLNTISYDDDVLTLAYETPNNDEYTYMVSNISGQVMATGTVRIPFFGDKILTLDLEELPAGVYIVSLIGANEVSSTTFLAPGF